MNDSKLLRKTYRNQISNIKTTAVTHDVHKQFCIFNVNAMTVFLVICLLIQND